jgi:hypothetical protein
MAFWIMLVVDLSRSDPVFLHSHTRWSWENVRRR